MKKYQEDRFEIIYSQKKLSASDVTKIWVDKETGVHYFFHKDGSAGGLTVLLDRDGKPVVTPNIEQEKQN